MDPDNPTDALDALTDVPEDVQTPTLEDDVASNPPAEGAPKTEPEGKTDDKKEDDDPEAWTKDLDKAVAKARNSEFGFMKAQAEWEQERQALAPGKKLIEQLKASAGPKEALRTVAEYLSGQSGMSLDDLMGPGTVTREAHPSSPPDFKSVFQTPEDAGYAEELWKHTSAHTAMLVDSLRKELTEKFGRYAPHLDKIVEQTESSARSEALKNEAKPYAELFVRQMALDPAQAGKWGGWKPTAQQAVDAIAQHPYLLQGKTTTEEKMEAVRTAVQFAHMDTDIKTAMTKKVEAPKGPGAPKSGGQGRMGGHETSAEGRSGRRASELSKRLIAGLDN